MVKTATVYIDGFNLYYGMVERGWPQYKWLDLYSFAKTIVPAGYKLDYVGYFTSHIKGDEEKHNRQEKYLNALRAHIGSNIKFIYGNYQMFPSYCKYCKSEPVYCRNCGKEVFKSTEKKTDVNISTYMLSDCFENLTDCIVLVSGDSDYDAPLKEIRRLFPLVQRIIAFPPKRKNSALIGLADSSFTISEDSFANCQLPDPVRNIKTGKEYYRPDTWVEKN